MTLILWLVTVVSRLMFNGAILGFDYAIYQPDGANYTFRTLLFLYENPLEAANKVSEWYALNGFKHNVIVPLTLLPENSPVWHLSAPRILYPWLSLPFAAALGIPGMLVIPTLALLGVFWIVHQIAKTLMRPELGLLFSIGIASSSTVSRWFVANLTDSLLTFLVGLIIIIEMKVKKLSNWILLVSVVVLLASATRFSFPIFLSLALGYLMIKEVPKAVTLLLSGFSGLIPLLFFNASSAVLPGSESDSITEKVLDLPLQSVKVLVVEIGQLVVLDRIFFILVLLSLFCAVQLRNRVGVLTLAVFFGVLAVSFINGTLGVNFRYQLPFLPFMAWSFIHYFKLISTPTIR